MNLPSEIVDGQVIPVARRLDPAGARRLAGSLLDGGINVLEITVEGEGGLEAIAAVARSEVVVGAGTVLGTARARRAVEAGARFLVSPHFDAGLVEWAIENQAPLIPGAFTPTEVAAARASGPPAVKLFPAHVGGPDYVRSLLGPFPDLRLIPTGGLTGDNVSAYLRAGAVAVGVGGWLTGDPSLVEERARSLRAQLSRQLGS